MRSSYGWDGAYNRFVDVDGSRTKMRAIGEETIANKGHNCDVFDRCDTISVCVAGDFNNELLNDKEIHSLREEIRELKELYPNAEVVFHKDIQPNRTCAGKLFTQDYLHNRILREKIEELDPEDKKKSDEIKKLQDKIRTLEKLVVLLKRVIGILVNKNKN